MNAQEIHPAASLAIAAAQAIRRYGRYAGSRHIINRYGMAPHPALLRLARQLDAASRALA